MDAGGVGSRLVYLVYDDDREKAELERFLQNESSLRHRSFLGIDDQENRVNRAQDALNLGTEVGVTGGVNDVDLRALISYRRILGVNRNTALLFERVRIHGAVVAMAALGHDGIGKSGLTVVDVGYDGYISDLHE